jgi:hypothetical protein
MKETNARQKCFLIPLKPLERTPENQFLPLWNRTALKDLPKPHQACYPTAMSLQEIKTVLVELPQADQDHLAAYLVHLRHQREAGLRREISSRLNDKNPDHWVSVDQLREQWKD